MMGGGHTGSGYDALPTVRAFPGSHKSPDRADQPAAVHPASVTAGGEHDHALRLVNDLPMLGDARKRRLDLGLSLLTAHVSQVHEEALESLDLPGSVLDAVSHAEHRPDPLPSADDAVVAAERLPVLQRGLHHLKRSDPIIGVLVA